MDDDDDDGMIYLCVMDVCLCFESCVFLFGFICC